jgi:cysteine synthase
MTHAASPTSALINQRNLLAMLDLAPTPLIPIQLDNASAIILGKCEFMNPSGSTKDRIATFILTKAWREGVVQRGDVVAEVSSGSTSIAMAMVCAHLGLKFIAIMPEGVSRERILMIEGFGGQVRFTAKSLGMKGANDACQELAASTKVFLPRQFQNMDNAQAHRVATAAEIAQWVKAHSPASVDTIAFTSGVGTGGTMVGLYHGLRDHGFKVLPFAVRPIASGKNILCADCFSSLEQCSFSSRIPGVLDGMSQIYRPQEIEHLQEIEVADEVAMDTTRELIRKGFPVGPSSGLNFAAALQVAPRLAENVRLVTILCDRMERYFSTELFTQWQ